MNKQRPPRQNVAEAPKAESPWLLLFLGGAFLLPFVVFSLKSDDSIREVKTVVQAVFAALALAALAHRRKPVVTEPVKHLTSVAYLAAGAIGMVLLSALWGMRGIVDPFSLVPVAAGIALAAIGVSYRGNRLAASLVPPLIAAGALTGILAALQRYTGWFRLPFEAPESRFFATGLIGNPGDVGGAAVIPALLALGALLANGNSRNRRILLSAGLIGCLAAIAVTGTVTAFVAFGAGALVLLLRSRAGRWAVIAAAVVTLFVVPFTGTGTRVLEKLQQVRSGQWDAVFTQRDIGVLAAVEMTRSRPLLGSGPGTFSNGFIPARAAAEARSGRRLVHRSGSAHFENAHSEPFTTAAECGLPAAVLAIAAFIWVTWKLARKRGTEDGPDALSDDTLVACLVAFGVLSLASFPLRLAVSAGPFAFLAGLALRRLSVSAPEEERRQFPPVIVYAAALALGLASLTRWTAFSRFAEAEGLVRTIRSAPPGVQPLALGDAGRLLESSLDLQPRRAVAWLTLGSVHRLLGDPDRAWEAFRTALLLEERAEIVINLSRLAEERGDRGLAEALALRAIWTLPRLIDAAPPSLDRSALSAEIERRERAASPPPLPDI